MLLPLVGGIVVVSCETNKARLPALQLNHRSKSVHLRSSTINKTNPPRPRPTLPIAAVQIDLSRVSS